MPLNSIDFFLIPENVPEKLLLFGKSIYAMLCLLF